MRRQLKEIVEETKYWCGESWNRIKIKRAAAEANRLFLPSHPVYKRQYNRDLGRGIIAAGTSITLSLGTLWYALGLEERSIKRAQEACIPIRCKEVLEEIDIQQGIDPKTDSRIRTALSFEDVKKANDMTSWVDDRLPIVVAAAVAIPANILAGLYLAKPYVNHRKRLAELNPSKQQ